MAEQSKITAFLTKASVPVSAISVVKSILTSIIDEAFEIVKNKAEKSKGRHTGGGHVTSATETAWLTSFPWLEIVSSSDQTKLFKCKLCQQAGKKVPMGMEGSANIQSSTLKTHDNSREHQDAVRLLLKRKPDTTEADVGTDDEFEVETTPSSVTESDKILFRTIYYCAKEEIPSKKINSLLQLQLLNGLEITYKNLSWDTITEIQECISFGLQKQLISKLRESDFFGIMIDESQDIGVQKRLSVCVRYVNDGEPSTSYLGSIQLEDGKAHTITNALHDALSKMGQEERKMVSLGTDGAATVVGRKTGVGVQIKAKYSPVCIQSHCVAHRLSLACVDAAKGIAPLETFKSRFNTLFYHFNASGVRTAKLHNVQQMLEDPVLKVKEAHNVRWLSLRNAVEAVNKCYPSIVVALGEIGESDPTARALHQYFGDSKTALLTGFMCDVHTQLAIFSTQLQKDLVFSEVAPLLDATIAGLQELAKGGQQFRIVEEMLNLQEGSLKGVQLTGHKENRPDLYKMMAKYVEALCDNMKQRLSEKDGEMIGHFGAVFEPQTFDQDLADKAMLEIVNFFGISQTTRFISEEGTLESKLDPLIEKDAILTTEWPMFRGMLTGSYKNLTTKVLCKRTIKMHLENRPKNRAK